MAEEKIKIDYKKQIEFQKKLGFEPIAAIICNGEIVHIDYINMKILEKLKKAKVEIKEKEIK